jgi:hypothetical protein
MGRGPRLSFPGLGALEGARSLADVDDFALVRFELDQAGELACDRLELESALHRGEVRRRWPLECDRRQLSAGRMRAYASAAEISCAARSAWRPSRGSRSVVIRWLGPHTLMTAIGRVRSSSTAAEAPLENSSFSPTQTP